MSYTVLEEFVVQRGDAVVHYSQVGQSAELTDDEGAELLAAGKVALNADPAGTPSGEPDEPVDDSDAATPDDGAGEALSES